MKFYRKNFCFDFELFAYLVDDVNSINPFEYSQRPFIDHTAIAITNRITPQKATPPPPQHNQRIMHSNEVHYWFTDALLFSQ